MLDRFLKKGLFVIILIGLLSPGAAFSQRSGPPSPETVALERRLDQIALEKRQTEQQMKASAGKVVPPYREYLLLQKSVRFADLSAELDRLQREGEEVAHLLISRGAPIKESAIRVFNLPPPAFPTFSGAPPLINIEASRVDEAFSYRPFWMFLFRLALYALLLAIVIFPTAALFAMFRRRRRLAPVIQLSSVRRRRGPDRPDQEFPKEKAA